MAGSFAVQASTGAPSRCATDDGGPRAERVVEREDVRAGAQRSSTGTRSGIDLAQRGGARPG